MAMGLEEWQVLQARLGTRRGQVLAPRLQQQQLKQQSTVPEELGFSLVLEAPAFPAGLVQFLGSEASQGRGLQLLQRPPQRQLSMELLEAWCLVGQALEFQVLESQVSESQVLGGLALWVDQELCHQLQPLKQPPKQPNMGPELEWELEAFPLTEWELVLGAFLVTVSELELEVFLEPPFPLQPRQQQPLRQQPQPRQPSMVLEE